MRNGEKNGANFIRKNVTSTLLFGAAAFLALFALWAIAYFSVRNEFLVPSLKDTLCSFGTLFKEKEFFVSYGNTLLRVVKAFLISFLPALICGVAAYVGPPVKKIFAVAVAALRSLPTMAVLLMILVWSTPGKAPVIVAFLSLFPLLYTGVINALSSVDEKYKKVCRVYRVPVYRQIFSMYLPQSLPYMLRDGGSALSFGVKLVVSAEVVSYTFKSMGGLMQDAKIYLDMPRLFALTLFAVLTGLVFETIGNLLAVAAERRVK